ncbi:GMC family oxidoreductase N-terminal domain-containing protein [Nocardia sp. NPDC056064]|uniref:GMC family oxidoreductase N-terminal domain-containing protein n=1 Tax=Nocardia sp. NPDC056064 TaxID=3345701 RepID=UPI0035E244FD
MTRTLVVGAGSAGCVLAARLSADPGHEVLVLEAGPVWPTPAAIPAELLDPGHLPVGPESGVVWRYPGNLVRGKLIGGSGAINGSYFIRPPAADLAAWSTVAGSPRWSYDALAPYFRELEHDLDFGSDPGHGDHGPIPVQRTTDPTPFTAEFAERCAAAGHTEIADLNATAEPARADGRSGTPSVADDAAGADNAARARRREHPPAWPTAAGARSSGRSLVGFGRVPLALSRGQRRGPALTHLYPALDRPNLTVTGATTVTRVLLRGTRAVGVEWARGREHGTTHADRVILCAGAIESAALLIRSGIGPQRQLRSLGLPVVHSAPVGSWCTDHPEIGLEFPGQPPAHPTVALEYVLELDDLELRPYTPTFTPGLRRLGVALMHPESTGELTLTSADPSVPPRMDQGYLRTAHDRARLRAGVELAADLFELRPGTIDDDWLREHLGTSQHLSGTCRMGPPDDPRAVVDEQGRTHGIDDLMVVDLSIVPVPLSRGPQVTVVTLAAAIADLLAV